MKPSLLQVLLSELILVSFLSTTLVPVGIWADESVTPPADQNTQSETPSSLISDSTPPLETTLPPSDTETEVLNPPSNEETLVSTGTSLNTRNSGRIRRNTNSSNTRKRVLSLIQEVHKILLQNPLEVFSISLKSYQKHQKRLLKCYKKKEVLREKSRPENEVLVQFNESNINVDSYVGQYQIRSDRIFSRYRPDGYDC